MAICAGKITETWRQSVGFLRLNYVSVTGKSLCELGLGGAFACNKYFANWWHSFWVSIAEIDRIVSKLSLTYLQPALQFIQSWKKQVRSCKKTRTRWSYFTKGKIHSCKGILMLIFSYFFLRVRKQCSFC